MNRSLNPFLRLLGGLVCVLIAILLLLWLTATDPTAAAQAHTGAAGASLVGSTVSDSPFGGHATIRFQPPGKASEVIEIKMTRPFWSRHWRKIS